VTGLQWSLNVLAPLFLALYLQRNSATIKLKIEPEAWGGGALQGGLGEPWATINFGWAVYIWPHQ